jgi:hypothetical protein
MVRPGSWSADSMAGASICERVSAVARNAVSEEAMTSESSIQTPVMTRPGTVCGTRSPYPTVVIVTSAIQMPLPTPAEPGGK